MKRLPKSLAPLCLLLSLAAPAAAQHRHDSGASGFSPCREQLEQAKLIPNLNPVNHPISPTNEEARKFFNQGLTLVYGFNHEEAARSFRRAAELDKNLAIAHWGIALAVGPNINIDIDPTCERFAYDEMQEALKLAEAPATNARDRAYVKALATRYTNAQSFDRQQLAVDYSVAMRQLVADFPEDLDAKTLYAESLMDLRPWKLWDNCGRPAQDTEEIRELIGAVLSKDGKHIGARHYQIHALEASQSPQEALESANMLRTLVPAAGHLRHMPSHIYARVGDYASAAASNVEAVQVDKDYVQGCAASIDAPTCLPVYVGHYYSHNLLFLAVAYGMQGRSQDAQGAAEASAKNALRYIKQQPSLEHFLPAPDMMLVRSARWNDILKPTPTPDPALHITSAMRHWARGMAHAALGEVLNAVGDRKLFEAEVRLVAPDASWGNNTASAMFLIPAYMLRGKIAAARNEPRAAVEFMRLALDAEAALVYDEPDPWFIPVRESLGAALLRDHDYREAEEVFREDLRRNPRSARSLLGLSKSLEAQGRRADADAARREFDAAWKNADTPLKVEDL